MMFSCEYYRDWKASSCERTRTIRIVRYGLDRIPTSTDTSFLEILSNKDSIQFKYKVTEESNNRSIYEFCKFYYNKDTVLYFQGKLCPLIDTKEFIIDEKRIKLKKFYYDEELECDEETTIYFNDSLGILSLYNDGWCTLIGTFEGDYYSKKIIESLLNDKTGFFPQNFNFLPPPPPPVLIEETLKILEDE